MRKIIIISLLLVFPAVLAAQESVPAEPEQPVYETVMFEGSAPITIDGDLSDWNGIGAPLVSLMNSHWIDKNAPVYTGLSDLTASFRACADNNFLYIAFDVKDDNVLFGESSQIFGQGLRDDAVDVYFNGNLSDEEDRKDGYDLNDGIVRVIRDVDSKIRLEGNVSSFRQIPYAWEESGVTADIKEKSGGYSVEICIPICVLGLEKIEVGTSIGFNTAVNDDDNGEDRDDKFCWSYDPDDISYKTTSVFGKLIIASSKPGVLQKSTSLTKSAVVEQGQDNEIVITLTGRPDNVTLTKEILKKDIKELNTRLKDLKSKNAGKKELIANSALMLAKSEKKWDEETFAALAMMTQESKISKPFEAWLTKGKIRMAKQFLWDKSVASGLTDEIVNKTIEKFGPAGAREGLFTVGVQLTKARKYEQANIYYQKILDLKTDIEQEEYECALAFTKPDVLLDKELAWQVVANYCLGYDYRRLNQFDKAIEHFTKAIETAEQLPPFYLAALSHYELGFVYQRKGAIIESNAQWKILLDKYSKDKPLYNRYGTKLSKERKFLPHSLYYVGKFARSTGNYNQAENYLKSIINDYPDSKFVTLAQYQLEKMNSK